MRKQILIEYETGPNESTKFDHPLENVNSCNSVSCRITDRSDILREFHYLD